MKQVREWFNMGFYPRSGYQFSAEGSSQQLSLKVAQWVYISSRIRGRERGWLSLPYYYKGRLPPFSPVRPSGWLFSLSWAIRFPRDHMRRRWMACSATNQCWLGSTPLGQAQIFLCLLRPYSLGWEYRAAFW
ncbi:hypothetical protein SUGI_0582910 [Cryptomeria japonica]|nr:hypothetical protein SUGI_0582910 [Cryptomeria japonica]